MDNNIMAKTIQIAPSFDEITIEGNKIKTDFGGGIEYENEVVSMVHPDVAKNALQIAIAMSSYEHQVIWLMNNWAESTRKQLKH